MLKMERHMFEPFNRHIKYTEGLKNLAKYTLALVGIATTAALLMYGVDKLAYYKVDDVLKKGNIIIKEMEKNNISYRKAVENLEKKVNK